MKTNRKGSLSPFRRYCIITEDVLTPQKRSSYICELAARGWIHPEICRPQSDPICRRAHSLVEVVCTPEHLGKVCSYMLEKEGWIIVEQVK